MHTLSQSPLVPIELPIWEKDESQANPPGTPSKRALVDGTGGRMSQPRVRSDNSTGIASGAQYNVLEA